MTFESNFDEASARLTNLIPEPASIKDLRGISFLSPETEVVIQEAHSEFSFTAAYIEKNLLSSAAQPSSKDHNSTINRICLEYSDDARLSDDEAYLLEISQSTITLMASHPNGLFMGANTLIQLAQPRYGEKLSVWVPHCAIEDAPRFEWRGMMLDVARHFFSVEDVKRVIDLLAVYKFNRLHLHLTDDQGWRIEIKSWPKLTAIGAATQVGGGKGGFYTQDEFVDLVSYALDRRITIVPEIDLPGHTHAALASYQELNADGLSPDLYTGIEVGFSTLEINKAETYRFISDVLGELATLTPGSYLHIGGDEAKSTHIDDYKRFLAKVQELVQSLGKQMVGWQEISQADLEPGCIVQYWTDQTEIAELPDGVQVVMSPASRTYLDMKYDPDCRLGLSWAGYINVQDAFTWDPQNYLDTIPSRQVIGLEAPLWSETLETIADIEYMLFPRLLALSQIGWSQNIERDFDQFSKRIAYQGGLLYGMGVNFFRSPFIDWI